MLLIPKTDDYLEVLTDEEGKNFLAINFSEYFKSIRKEQNLKKLPKLIYIFPTTPDEAKQNICNQILHHYNVDSLNLLHPELQLINTTCN